MIADKARSRLAALTLLGVVALGVAGCGAGAATRTGPLRVVAAENVWGDIAARIGGSRVAVTSIISDPTADPHIYETSPSNAAAVDAADLVIENGAGYDDFMDNLLGAATNRARRLIGVQTAVSASGANPNPHFWYSPTDVTTVATDLAAALAALDPGGAPTFRANLVAFLASYAPYRQVLTEIATRHPGATVAYTERVAGYLVEAAGMVVVSPFGFAEAVESGTDPAPSDVVAMDSVLTQHRAALLLYNSQVTSPATLAVRSLARSAGIPVVGVAETIPAGQPSFVAWQLAQARAILAALGG
ncbi:MAG: metal ABC transporter solute-binding protein, Zn/Mn family [Candidatus Dormibacteria bacterium]